MRLRGNDGGSYIDALVLDMSINVEQQLLVIQFLLHFLIILG